MAQKRTRTTVVAVIAAAAFCLPLRTARAGTDAAAFLNNGIGARALGMGGAFVSVCDDPTALYWNPAGLGKIRRISVTAMGQSVGAARWDTLKDVTPQFQFVGVAFPLNAFRLPGISAAAGTFGVGFVASGLSNVSYTTIDESGRIVRDSFDDSENACLAAYGFPLLEDGAGGLYAGLSLTYATQRFSKIAGASASGYDFGAGILYGLGNLNLGLVLQRGIVMQWANGHTDTGALTAKFGVSNRFPLAKNLSILGSADLVQRRDQPLSASAGAEFAYQPHIRGRAIGLNGIAVRGGIDGFAVEDRYGYRDKINSTVNLTAGLGIGITCLGYDLQMDYVMGSYRLGEKNRFSLSLYF